LQDQIITLVFSNNEITWESLLLEIVKEEGFDPWNVNISTLTEKYIKTIKQLEKLDFKLSGKVLLAASILLKIKSDHITRKEMSKQEKNQIIQKIQEEELDEINQKKIVPRIPLPRERRVTLNELVDSLRKALEVKDRRVKRHKEVAKRRIELKFKKVNINTRISNLYQRIQSFFNRKKDVFFTDLLPSRKRDDVVDTYLPLVYMANENKIQLEQKKLFGKIRILKNEGIDRSPPVREEQRSDPGRTAKTGSKNA